MDTEYFEIIRTDDGLNGLAANSCELLDFGLLKVGPGGERLIETRDREYGLVILTGTVTVTVDEHRFDNVGGRADVFAGKPSLVYAPGGSIVTVTSETGAEVALCSAPGGDAISPYLVGPDDVLSGRWGTHNTRRTFDYLIDGSRPSTRLYVAEVTVESGNWATYPPHRHERDDPSTGEIYQEEIYFYRVSPSTGFGFAGQYGDGVQGDHACIIRDNLVHKMPAGYHTLTSAPGYRVWYLAFYAGDRKEHHPFTDPDHAWYAGAELALRNSVPD